MSDHCLCLTTKRTQCERSPSTESGDDPRFCWQHQNCTEKVTPEKPDSKTKPSTKPSTKPNIQISTISKNKSKYCGIPENCLGSANIIPNIDEPDIQFINLVRCLHKNQVDENIIAVQLSILFNLTKILSNNDQLKIKKKQELLIHLLPEYCTAYSYWTYSDFYTKIVNIKSFQEQKKKVEKIVSSMNLKNNYLLKFQNSKQLINILHIINSVGQYVHKNSSYAKGNYSLMDFFNDVLSYKDQTFVGKNPSKIAKIGPPQIYMEDLNYAFGCNCFCRTLLMGTLLKTLAINQRIDLSPESIRYVHLGGQATCPDGHIMLAIHVNGDQSDLSNYLYVESTYDADADFESNIIAYIGSSIDAFKKSDTFNITDAPIDLIVISEYLNRNPLSLTFWLSHAKDLLNHEIFNNILIYSAEISETERFGRIYRQLILFSNSSSIWLLYQVLMESLPKIIGKLQHEIKEKIKHKNKNIEQILKQYLDLPRGHDTNSIYEHYKSIVEFTLNKLV